MKKIFVLLMLTSVVFLELFSSKKTNVKYLDKNGLEHVIKLSVRDKEKLFVFFRYLFVDDCFAYPILGSKPLAWACYKKSTPLFELKFGHPIWRCYHRQVKEGWKIWSKFKIEFPDIEFILEDFSDNNGWASIMLINKEQFNFVVNQNKKDFENVLQRQIKDGYQLLKESKNSSLMDDTLKSHQALMGIVLGYGRNNAWLFHQEAAKKQPIPCVWGETADMREGEIRVRFASSEIEEALATESIPSFGGIPDSEESIALKQNYLKTQQKVVEYYKGKDFLEATLSLLAGYRPD